MQQHVMAYWEQFCSLVQTYDVNTSVHAQWRHTLHACARERTYFLRTALRRRLRRACPSSTVNNRTVIKSINYYDINRYDENALCKKVVFKRLKRYCKTKQDAQMIRMSWAVDDCVYAFIRHASRHFHSLDLRCRIFLWKQVRKSLL